MIIYTFWNNKGGTGKTSLMFQATCRYAEKYSNKKILAVDLCPQANLSELFLGGLMGHGSDNLFNLYKGVKRKSIGGYFQDRLPMPYMINDLSYEDYICKPINYNDSVPENIDLLAGDPLVELQSNTMSTLSNTQVPGINTWLAIIDWLKDYIKFTNNKYDTIFIDTNPSFSIYTQIALSVANKLIMPVMADDSSRRAIQNSLSLIHGINLPSAIYNKYAFSTNLKEANRSLPCVHLIVKNRITQYMTAPASAYHSVLEAINNDIEKNLLTNPNIFTFKKLEDGVVEIRDFQTTGVIAFAEGKPFSKVKVGKNNILGKDTQIREDYLDNCIKAIDKLVNKL